MNINIDQFSSIKASSIFFFSYIFSFLIFGLPLNSNDTIPILFFASYVTILLSIIEPSNRYLEFVLQGRYFKEFVIIDDLNYGIENSKYIKQILNEINAKIYTFCGLSLSIILMLFRTIPKSPFPAIFEPKYSSCSSLICFEKLNNINDLTKFSNYSIGSLSNLVIYIPIIIIVTLVGTIVILYRNINDDYEKSLPIIKYIVIFEQLRRPSKQTIDLSFHPLINAANPNIYLSLDSNRENDIKEYRDLLDSRDTRTFKLLFEKNFIETSINDIKNIDDEFVENNDFNKLTNLFLKSLNTPTVLNPKYECLFKHGFYLYSKKHINFIAKLNEIISFTRTYQFNIIYNFIERLGQIKIKGIQETSIKNPKLNPNQFGFYTFPDLNSKSLIGIFVDEFTVTNESTVSVEQEKDNIYVIKDINNKSNDINLILFIQDLGWWYFEKKIPKLNFTDRGHKYKNDYYNKNRVINNFLEDLFKSIYHNYNSLEEYSNRINDNLNELEELIGNLKLIIKDLNNFQP